jgi:hypothetical protein
VVQVLKKEDKMKVLKYAMAVLVISGLVEVGNPFGRQVVRSGEYAYAQQGKQPEKKQAEQQRPKEEPGAQQLAKGAKLIIWGGRPHMDGAIYDIDTDQWEKIPEPPIGKRMSGLDPYSE